MEPNEPEGEIEAEERAKETLPSVPYLRGRPLFLFMGSACVVGTTDGTPTLAEKPEEGSGCSVGARELAPKFDWNCMPAALRGCVPESPLWVWK